MTSLDGPALGHTLGHELALGPDGYVDFGQIDPARLGADRRVFLWVLYADGRESSLDAGYSVVLGAPALVRWPGPFESVVATRATNCMWSTVVGGLYNCTPGEVAKVAPEEWPLPEPGLVQGLFGALVLLLAIYSVHRLLGRR